MDAMRGTVSWVVFLLVFGFLRLDQISKTPMRGCIIICLVGYKPGTLIISIPLSILYPFIISIEFE